MSLSIINFILKLPKCEVDLIFFCLHGYTLISLIDFLRVYFLEKCFYNYICLHWSNSLPSYFIISSTFFNTFNLVFRYHLLCNIIFQLKLHSFLSKEEWSLVKRNVEKVLVWIESLDVFYYLDQYWSKNPIALHYINWIPKKN